MQPDAVVTEAELIESCNTCIAGYKCPRGIGFRVESLPLG